ncbi:MAG: US12 family protein [Clostridia bacterium]|nr:US12 family protein [Clostridia bacterium]
MTIGNTRQALAERRVLREGDVEISRRAYNMIIAGMLLWGFLLNYLIVTLWSGAVISYAARGGSTAILIGYFVCALAGSFMVNARSPIVSFIGYNLIVLPIGVVLCLLLPGYDASVISTAIIFTAAVTFVFALLGTLYPAVFLSMGRALMAGLGILVIGGLILSLFGRSGGLLTSYLAAGLFSLFIGFDWARCNVCASTLNNAVSVAANLYLDIINLFLRVLSIIGRRRD